MKNTALLIDTNIILDWLLEREPFTEHAEQIMKDCINGKTTGFLAIHTILNIFYITRKKFTVEERNEIGLMLCSKFNIIGINSEMLISVLNSDKINDLEDGLQMQCAADNRLDYIITRDTGGFKNSTVKALLPEDFLSL